MTDFSSLFVAGVPILGGGTLATFGKSIFVDKERGSNSFDGLSMKINGGSGPKATYLAAYNLADSGNSDVIYLSSEGSHTVDTTIDWTKNNVHTVGLPLSGRMLGQRARVSMGAAATGSGIAIVKNTGKGNSWTGIKFRSTDDQANSLYAFADGGEFTEMNYCLFEKDEDLDQTGAAEFLCNADGPTYRNCTFGNMIYTVSVARQNVLFTRETITGKVARDVHFVECVFQGKTSSTAFVNLRATTNDIERYCLMERPKFLSAKTSSVTQDEAIGIASALTDGQIYLEAPFIDLLITNIATVSSGVQTNLPLAATLGGRAIVVT